jgi:hypothetical protein
MNVCAGKKMHPRQTEDSGRSANAIEVLICIGFSYISNEKGNLTGKYR